MVKAAVCPAPMTLIERPYCPPRISRESAGHSGSAARGPESNPTGAPDQAHWAPAGAPQKPPPTERPAAARFRPYAVAARSGANGRSRGRVPGRPATESQKPTQIRLSLQFRAGLPVAPRKSEVSCNARAALSKSPSTSDSDCGSSDRRRARVLRSTETPRPGEEDERRPMPLLSALFARAVAVAVAVRVSTGRRHLIENKAQHGQA